MRRRWLPALALALVAAGCGGGEAEEGGTTTVAGEQANDHGTADVSAATEVELELDDFYFEPTVLSGGAGQTLTLRALNEGDLAHTFTIDEAGVDVELEPGGRTEIEVTFPGSGALLYYCRFHAGQGMRGGLSVGGDLGPATAPAGGGATTEETDTGGDTGGGGSGYDYG